ncbi:MAG: dihydroorotase [Bacteroidetes bacterium GWF2_42_66]|nr:MAG: dihydroorotase [Bacteroidetes bacterium GWA2_42_15]OFY03527.1 MAG: dihydroorotase [Bacteroidetes bacterium GWE2_42_39]OFY45893.1 MAG: dihydroorotase [Bacteroidetes bacterium GWF2_42_66]HBL75135.1 dihydroorotase [Prolixibacteraceae bacterium]HCU59594.1 dihydroorotase [Prolixibacteraceae bacterium]
MKTLLKNAVIINEGISQQGSVLIEDAFIKKIYTGRVDPATIEADQVIDATGKYLIPGVIDDQVHFREPGLTHKGDITTESRAAVAGGVTSWMEMPNTNPQTVTQELLEQKYQRAAQVSPANYSFYMGATNDNLEEVLKTDPSKVCGIKVFMGSSTGNMLVDDAKILSGIFKDAPTLVAAHCEDEATIQENIKIARASYGENIPVSRHAYIRSAEACFRSSSKAVELAARFGTQFHVLHLSTAQEMSLFSSGPVKDKLITAEVCVHHLWFDEKDYITHGNRIKWNPSIKTAKDKEALWEALLSDRIDMVATDHAPHTLEEKSNTYFKAPSGGPLIQHSLVAMLEMSRKGFISLEKVVQKMCHAPADLFRIDRRGYIREGYFADLVVVDPNENWVVSPENILYKCGWSPFEGTEFSHQVTHTFVNGELAFRDGTIDESVSGKRLEFIRE